MSESCSTDPRPRILFIGALPPPFIGPFMANETLLQNERLNSIFEIIHLDISDNRNISNIGKLDFVNIYLALTSIVRGGFILLSKSPEVVYLNISQATLGYLRDLGYILPAIALKKPIVLHLRGSEFLSFYQTLPHFLKSLTRYILKRIQYLIVLGDNIRTQVSCLIDSNKIKVIPNGINSALFSHNNTRPVKDILFLSSLQKRKGIFDFLQAIVFLVKKELNFSVTIAGSWYDERDRQAAYLFVKKHKLESVINFIGPVYGDQKMEVYQQHKLFVFPPNQPEGLPWVILEAMSSALPVITTDQGAISEVVVNGETGYIVQSCYKEIARKIRHLLDHPQLGSEMGMKGKNRIMKLYSEERYLRTVEDIFRQCTKKADTKHVI